MEVDICERGGGDNRERRDDMREGGDKEIEGTTKNWEDSGWVTRQDQTSIGEERKRRDADRVRKGLKR